MSRIMEVKQRSKKSLFESKYIKMHSLGSGNFGKVYLVEERSTNTLYAAKIVDKRIFKAGDQKLHAEKEQKICETFAKGLSHKHIVSVHEVFTEHDLIYIIMDYVEGGELFHKIRERKKLTERQARIWFQEMIEAVDYIHQNNIVHRDLKPENGNDGMKLTDILYSTVLINGDLQVQICDFGFGNIIQQRQEILSTYCGSPFYAAPEMVTATPYEGPPADIWSCGVILYAMLTGYLPFQAEQMPELFRKIKKGEYRLPSHVTELAVDLIKRLLCVDARRRITAKECLSHPWMTQKVSEDEPLVESLTSSVYSGDKYVSDDSLSSAGLETKQHYYPNVVPEKKSFFKRFFKKKVQVAPSENQTNEKKMLKQRVIGRFKSFFLKNSMQQPKLLEASNKI